MEKNVSINKINLNNNIVKVIKGSIIAFLISIMLLFIFASLLVYTNIQENTIKPVVIIISIISILVGSSLSSIKIKRKGIVNGALVGTIYIMRSCFCDLRISYIPIRSCGPDCPNPAFSKEGGYGNAKWNWEYHMDNTIRGDGCSQWIGAAEIYDAM